MAYQDPLADDEPGGDGTARSATSSDPTDRARSYGVVMGVYATTVVVAAIALRRAGRALPARIGAYDLVVTAVATHRLARLLSTEPVTRPLRAPFTEFVEVSGPAELRERARDSSRLRHTVGELVSCPFCLDQWIATGFAIGHVGAPRATRVAAATFASAGMADWLHHGLARLRG